MIVEQILEAKRQNIKRFPVRNNRASELGHSCERYLVYLRTRWEERALHDVNLQLIFDLGRKIEEITIQDLREAGIQIIEQQRSFVWGEYNIAGMVDGQILLNGETIPFEVKSCSPYVFDKINTIEDLKNGQYHYLRKYPAQLCLYLLMEKKDRGVFIFKNKQTGAYKEIWMNIDRELGDTLLKRAESVNKHIAEGTLPAPINEDMWCNDCGFIHICLPEKAGKGVETGTSMEILDGGKEGVKKITCGVIDVRVRTGKTKAGKDYQLFTIYTNGQEFKTFSEFNARIAKEAKESAMKVDIVYRVSQYGNDIETITLREPGEEG